MLNEIASRGLCGYVDYVLERTPYGRSLPRGVTLGRIFDGAYELLRREYRCEYVYKNALANKVLLGRHSLNTSTLLTELQAGRSKADLVIVNGTSTVYEIKTELDSVARLQSQVESYRRVFDRIVVVTHESQLARVSRSVGEDVGITLLSGRYTLHRIRRASPNAPNVSPAALFSCLRRGEYRQAVVREFGRLPDVPDDQMYVECRKLFCSLPPAVAHRRAVEQLKNRSPGATLRPFIDSVPYSLRLLCLARSLTTRQRATFLAAITSSYRLN